LNDTTSLRSRLEQLLRQRGMALGLLLAAVVALPGLGFGLFIDDYVHLLSLQGKVPVTEPPFDLFLFAPGDPVIMKEFSEVVQFPWFTDPEVKIHFFRPLSSWLMAMDYAVFGAFIPAYHFHSLLWYLAFCAAAALLFRRLLPLSLAVPALILFAVDDSHTIPAYWWSNRNAIVSGLPALLALWAHLKWREDGKAWGLPASLALLGVGFLGSEGALAITAYLGAYELFARKDALVRRLGALLPAASLSVAYLLYYKWAGYGVARSGIYLDPMAESGAVLAEAPSRFIMLLGSLFGNVPVEGSILNSAFDLYLIAASVAMVLVVGALLAWAWGDLKEDERRHVRWLGIGAVLSVAPSLATFPAGRLLLPASLGACVVLAVILRHTWLRLSTQERLPRLVVSVLIIVHILAPLGAWLVTPFVIAHVDNRFREIVLTATLDDEDSATTFLFLNAPDPMLGVYTPLVREYYGKALRGGWYTLSMAPVTMDITRTAPNRLTVDLLDGEIMGSVFEQLFRSRANPLSLGETLELRGYSVTITALGELGPTRVDLLFDEVIEDSAIQFLVWQDGAMEHSTMPALGETMHLPRSAGFLGIEILFR